MTAFTHWRRRLDLRPALAWLMVWAGSQSLRSRTVRRNCCQRYYWHWRWYVQRWRRRLDPTRHTGRAVAVMTGKDAWLAVQAVAAVAVVIVADVAAASNEALLTVFDEAPVTVIVGMAALYSAICSLLGAECLSRGIRNDMCAGERECVTVAWDSCIVQEFGVGEGREVGTRYGGVQGGGGGGGGDVCTSCCCVGRIWTKDTSTSLRANPLCTSNLRASHIRPAPCTHCS